MAPAAGSAKASYAAACSVRVPARVLTPPNHFCFAKDLVLAPCGAAKKKHPPWGVSFHGSGSWARTSDPFVNSELLYH